MLAPNISPFDWNFQLISPNLKVFLRQEINWKWEESGWNKVGSQENKENIVSTEFLLLCERSDNLSVNSSSMWDQIVSRLNAGLFHKYYFSVGNTPTDWRRYTRYNNADGILGWALWKSYTLLKSVFEHDNSLWIQVITQSLKILPTNITKHLLHICFGDNVFMKNVFCLLFGIFVSCENKVCSRQLLIWSLKYRTLLHAIPVIMCTNPNVLMIKNRKFMSCTNKI